MQRGRHDHNAVVGDLLAFTITSKHQDVSLERHDGLEILELIRQLYPKQRAILVSGHAPSDRVQAAMDRGLDWLQKPYSLEALAATVAKALAAGPQGDDLPFAR